MINFKVRLKNPVFLAQVAATIVVSTVACANVSPQELVTWSSVGKLIVDAVSNPYLLVMIGLSVFNAINDPTTKGLSDSSSALGYDRPSARK